MKLLKSLLALATAMTVSTTVLAEESVLSDVEKIMPKLRGKR